MLAIGGSDSNGGAGVQADIKTITVLGAYAATAVTAVTVQDSLAVHAVHAVPADIVAAQIACALADPGADALKTGMLVDAATIRAVIDVLARHGAGLPLVVDPVMLASSGDRLLDADAMESLRVLFGLATLITPNAPEAAALCGHPVTTLTQMRRAAAALRGAGARAVLLKGGHLEGDTLTDLLLADGGEILFSHPRQHTSHTHGTGCTLAAAIAVGLARGVALAQSIDDAIDFVQRAIAAAPGFGAGNGPLGHARANEGKARGRRPLDSRLGAEPPDPQP